MHSSFTLPKTAPLALFIKEIKLRFFYSLLGIGLTFGISYLHAVDLLYWIIEPNTKMQSHFVFLNIPEALYASLKIAGFVTFCACIPFVWYHIWSFLAPSYTQSERKKLTHVNGVFFFFFVSSMWWSVHVGIPMLTDFLLQFQIQQTSLVIEYQATLHAYISWIWSCMVITLIIAQFPTIAFMLILGGKLTPMTLTHYRKGLCILCVLMAAFISPPDILLQSMLALGFYVYSEFIIWCLFIYASCTQEV